MKYGQITGIDKPVSRLVQGAIMLSADRLQEGLTLLDGAYALVDGQPRFRRVPPPAK